jgi:hypothetical protein
MNKGINLKFKKLHNKHIEVKVHFLIHEGKKSFTKVNWRIYGTSLALVLESASGESNIAAPMVG